MAKRRVRLVYIVLVITGSGGGRQTRGRAETSDVSPVTVSIRIRTAHDCPVTPTLETLPFPTAGKAGVKT